MRAVPASHLKDLGIISDGLEAAIGGRFNGQSTTSLFIFLEGDMTLPVYDEAQSKIVGEFIHAERGMVYRPLKEPREPVPSNYM